MQLAADVLEHFTVGLHGLNQILHDLHNIVTSKCKCVFYQLQGTDAGGHLADGLHGLQNVLLHSHIFTSEI